jgi:hypothetical protein
VADKNFKVKTGITSPNPIAITDGGTGQTSASNALNALLPVQTSAANKILSSDGTNPSWITPVKGVNSGTTAQRPASPSTGDLYYNTDESFLQVYDKGAWYFYGIIGKDLTAISATNQGTGRAYNNGQMSVSFTQDTTGGVPKTVTIYSSPQGLSVDGSSSPVTFTGLTSGVAHQFYAMMSNKVGNFGGDLVSTAVTATTVPQAPTISAVAGDSQAVLTLTGNTGGSAITSYTITSSPATTTKTASSSPYTFTGLTNGTSYTFTATATNANGTSILGSASNSITPQVLTAFEYLVIAGGGGGGVDYAGGGGGGGYRSNFGGTKLNYNAGTQYTITVGAGGYAGNRGNGGNGGSGTASSFVGGSISISGTGGGYGAQYFAVGGNGGSGGGGGGGYGTQTYNNGGSGNAGGYTPPEGYKGGIGYGPSGYGSNRYGGGGGSPVAAGTDSTSGSPGVGASGISNSISGSALTYGRGGDGCTSQQANPTRGSTPYFGEGGSGGGENIQGSAGSSGTVIIKAAVQASSISGSYSNPSTGIYIFTSSGSITF